MELKLLKGMKENSLFRILAFVGVLFFNIVSLLAQEINPGEVHNYSSAAEINSRLKTPKSPEAAAFEKYGNTPVNLYTGTPDISIPLHTFKGREYDLPMSLTYDASGIKVNQIATNVGLGWNLNFGGRISRMAQGVPDDIPLTSPYNDSNSTKLLDFINNPPYIINSEDQLNAYLLDIMKPITQGVLDPLLDIYSLNVNGMSDYIVRDLSTNNYHTLINPKISVISFGANEWKIINEDGTEFYFDNVTEVTDIVGGADDLGDGGIYTGISTTTWMLTKIISKNKFDVYDFTYSSYNWNNFYSTDISSKNWYETLNWQPTIREGHSRDLNKTWKTNQQMSKQIIHNGSLICEFSNKARLDLKLDANSYQDGNALDEILFYNYKQNNLSPNSDKFYKKIKFNQSYFGNDTSINLNPTRKRLKLDDLTIYGINFADGKKYKFEYDRPSQIPDITSNAQDLLGLFNYQNAPTLVRKITLGSRTYGDNNRYINFNAMTIGTLTKITYPTGGSTTFEYEQNEVVDTSSTNINYTPGHYGCDTTTYINNLNENENTCSFLPNNHIMDGINLGNFLGVNYNNVMADYRSPITSYFEIPESTNHSIYVSGQENAPFLIQKLPNCSNAPFTISGCYVTDENGNQNLKLFNVCMKPAEDIFIHGSTDYSYPTDYVLGGLVTGDNQINGQYFNGNISLQAGKYQLTTWRQWEQLPEEGEGSIFYRANIVIERCIANTTWIPPTIPINTYTHTSTPVEGFRVKSIKDYTAATILASEKEYKYIQDIESNFPSGVILSKAPESKTYSSMSLQATSPSTGACIYVPSYQVSSQGILNSPNIGYNSVFEVEKNNNITNGFTQTKYFTGLTGLVTPENGVASFEPIYQNGKVSEKNIYNKNKTLKSKEKYTYFSDGNFYEQTSFSFQKNAVSKFAFWNSDTGLQYADGYCGGSFEQAPVGASPPPNFGDNDWISTQQGEFSFGLTTQSIIGKFGYLAKKETTTYPELGGEIKKSEEYIYNESDFRLQSKITNNSDTEIRQETYTYHPEYPKNTEKIINISITDNSGLLTQRENVYTDYGTTSNGVANLVSEIKTAKGDNALESRLLLDYNTTTKNIVTTISPTTPSPTNDNFDSYIFGYNEMFPVAKLSGVKYSQISANRISTIKSLTNVAITPASELSVATELNKLRVDFPNAQITTYTYNPVIGVTSETNPSGDTKYFEYDELSRLKRIKDKNGNILSENEYKYKHN